MQAEALEQPDYFHVELAEHDVIFAEGAAAETSLDDKSIVISAADPVPRFEDEAEVEALHRRLLDRARPPGAQAMVEPTRPRGNLDVVRHDLIEGWAFDPAAPKQPVMVVLLDNGAEIARLPADRYREDLEAAGIGDGRHSFSVRVPGGLATGSWHRLELYAEADWVLLNGVPAVLKPVEAEKLPAAVTLGPLRGNLELVGHNRIGGWAQDPADAERAVGLVFLANGRVVGRLLANRHRDDLAAAGVGSGRHGFELILLQGAAFPALEGLRKSACCAKPTVPSCRVPRRPCRGPRRSMPPWKPGLRGCSGSSTAKTTRTARWPLWRSRSICFWLAAPTGKAAGRSARPTAPIAAAGARARTTRRRWKRRGRGRC